MHEKALSLLDLGLRTGIGGSCLKRLRECRAQKAVVGGYEP